MIPAGIGTWPRRRKLKSGEHPAIIFRGRATSYAQLADRVDHFAAALQQHGVGPGDRVAYLGANHPSFVEALFASALLGAIFVPLNTRLSIPELEYQLSDSGARILINSSALEPQASAASAQLPIVRFVVSDPDPTDPVTISSSAEEFELAIEQADASALETPEVTLDDRAIVLYTSGTTGRPKGAVLTHGALTWNAFNVLVDYDIASTDRSLMISPLFHVASLGMGCLPVLLKGATLLLEERFVPADALRAIEQLKATTISGVPTTYQLMMEDAGWATTDISSLRLLTCGGSAVPDRVRDAFEERGLAFSGGYGMTETSPGVTMLPPVHSRERAGSAGLAHFFTEYRIATGSEPESGAESGAGSGAGRGTGSEAGRGAGEDSGILNRGEIEVRGPNVFAEYWQNDTATRDAFTDDGWLLTGDIGYSDDDGFLYIVDRAKDMIISGGENIYSAEVERAIMQIPGVTGVAIIGVPHEKWGEVPHAVVTLAGGHTLDPEELVAHLSTRLARYKVPKTLEVIEELPRTASGKVQKHVLRARYDTGTTS